MRSSQEFRTTVRRGVRVGRPTLVVHADLADHVVPAAGASRDSARVGFVVSKSVGDAVTRNRVRRRLRHMVAARLVAEEGIDPDLRIVVRALPAAAREPRRLGEDLSSAWQSVLTRIQARAH